MPQGVVNILRPTSQIVNIYLKYFIRAKFFAFIPAAIYGLFLDQKKIGDQEQLLCLCKYCG